MTKVVGVRFSDTGKMYYFDPKGLPDMDTEMRRLANGTIAKLERMTDADFDGQRFDFTGE